LAGDDFGYGGDGNDYFYAGAGNDVLSGGAGLDVLLGRVRSTINRQYPLMIEVLASGLEGLGGNGFLCHDWIMS
jgi:Ca2+-binding RTX toxin-like protein